MSHNLEIVNGKAQMAWVGEEPWHGLGTRVPADLTPAQMLEAAGLDWRVEKVPAFSEYQGATYACDFSTLIRDVDGKKLASVANDWNPVQNQEAFEFFHEYVMAGDMEMHTAGSLQEGKIVWGLARIKESFELFGGDEVVSYLLFTNYHKYGFATDVRFTPTRVVCNNTLSLALNERGNTDRVIKVSHRNTFNATMVKEHLGIATHKLAQYKEMANFLGSHKATQRDVMDYFKAVFPKKVQGKEKDEMSHLESVINGGAIRDDSAEVSRNAKAALSILETQPGAEFAKGTWWQPFNAVTYMIDHVVGRSDDSRLASAWYGPGRTLKTKALELALEMANK